MSAQDKSLMLYELDYFKNPARSALYSSEQKSHIIRPYSRVQTSAFDFNYKDEFAFFAEPLGVELKQNSCRGTETQADKYL
jgi:hypothetical protein